MNVTQQNLFEFIMKYSMDAPMKQFYADHEPTIDEIMEVAKEIQYRLAGAILDNYDIQPKEPK